MFTSFILKKTVECRLIFTKVAEVDTLNEKFNAQATIELRWKDPDVTEEYVNISLTVH